jgi:hypothetical protein
LNQRKRMTLTRIFLLSLNPLFIKTRGAQLQGLSISYRIGMGSNKGKKAYTLQSYGPIAIEDREPSGVPKYAGYSLHTSVSCKTKQRRKLERLCRYVARSALSDQRLNLSSTGKVIYSLKTPYSDGTTHVVLDPLDFISRLASLVPPPWQNLTRYYGVFATASKHRAQVMLTPSEPDKEKVKQKDSDNHTNRQASGRRMTWSQRLARVFQIDISNCPHCVRTAQAK